MQPLRSLPSGIVQDYDIILTLPLPEDKVNRSKEPPALARDKSRDASLRKCSFVLGGIETSANAFQRAAESIPGKVIFPARIDSELLCGGLCKNCSIESNLHMWCNFRIALTRMTADASGNKKASNVAGASLFVAVLYGNWT